MTRNTDSVPDGRSSTRPEPSSAATASRSARWIASLAPHSKPRRIGTLIRRCGNSGASLRRGGERRVLFAQRAQHGERGDDGVARGVLVEADDVAGILAAEDPFFLLHQLEHVTVADRRARERDAAAVERLFEAEVAHLRADEAARHRAAPPVVERDHIEQLVAVVRATLGIDHDQPIAVAVERDAEVGPMLDHRRLQIPRMRRADTGVDIEPVRLVTDGDHFGAEFMEHRRRDVIPGAVRAIDDDFQSFEVELVGEGALAEFDVASRRRRQAETPCPGPSTART